jgi:hypothetical protein
MSAWTRDRPGVGNMAGVESLAGGLEAYGARLGGLSDEVVAVGDGVLGSWRGAAAEQFGVAVGKVPGAVGPAQASARALSGALRAYGEQVRSIDA